MTRFVRIALLALCAALPFATAFSTAQAQNMTGAGGERTQGKPGVPDDVRQGARGNGKVDPTSDPTHTGGVDPEDKADPATATKDDAATGTIDINSATGEELKKLPGVNDEAAGKIISGRPYSNKTQLKKLLGKETYDKLQNRIVAKKAKKK